MAILNPEVVITYKVNAKQAEAETKKLTQNFKVQNKVTRDGILVQQTLAKVTAKGTIQTKTLTKRTEQFRAEYLSLLFGGMAISQMFEGHINQMKQLTGITTITGIAFKIALLKPMLSISKQIINLTTEFLKLDPTGQNVVGWSILGVYGVGKVATSVGQWVLLLAGVDKIFGLSLLESVTTFFATAFTGTALATGLIAFSTIMALILDKVEKLASKWAILRGDLQLTPGKIKSLAAFTVRDTGVETLLGEVRRQGGGLTTGGLFGEGPVTIRTEQQSREFVSTIINQRFNGRYSTYSGSVD